MVLIKFSDSYVDKNNTEGFVLLNSEKEFHEKTNYTYKYPDTLPAGKYQVFKLSDNDAAVISHYFGKGMNWNY